MLWIDTDSSFLTIPTWHERLPEDMLAQKRPCGEMPFLHVNFQKDGFFGTHVSKFVYITPTIIGLLHFGGKTFLKRFQKHTFTLQFRLEI